MANYAALQSSIESAVDQYESYKSQSLRLNFDNLSLGTPATLDAPPKSPGKSHAKRASLAIPGLARLGSSDGKSSSRPTQLRTQSNDSVREQLPQSPFNSTFTGERRPTSPSIHASSPLRKEFAVFVNVAIEYETRNHLLDMEFLILVFEFMRSEHPYTTNSLSKAVKTRHTAKARLWTAYTSEMQGLARSYAAGKPLSTAASSPFTSSGGTSDKQRELHGRKSRVKELVAGLESSSEKTCAESILSATTHLYAQAIKDIHARYNMPDPINDKTTSIERHNERVRVFNQLVHFVCEDLSSLEKSVKNSTSVPVPNKKEKKGQVGVVGAIKSLHVEDYPPYK